MKSVSNNKAYTKTKNSATLKFPMMRFKKTLERKRKMFPSSVVYLKMMSLLSVFGLRMNFNLLYQK
jgi:hypothetical protein